MYLVVQLYIVVTLNLLLQAPTNLALLHSQDPLTFDCITAPLHAGTHTHGMCATLELINQSDLAAESGRALKLHCTTAPLHAGNHTHAAGKAPPLKATAAAARCVKSVRFKRVHVYA